MSESKRFESDISDAFISGDRGSNAVKAFDTVDNTIATAIDFYLKRLSPAVKIVSGNARRALLKVVEIVRGEKQFSDQLFQDGKAMLENFAKLYYVIDRFNSEKTECLLLQQSLSTKLEDLSILIFSWDEIDSLDKVSEIKTLLTELYNDLEDINKLHTYYDATNYVDLHNAKWALRKFELWFNIEMV